MFRLLFRLDSASRLHPGVPSAFQRAHFFVPFFYKHLRHTGACMLAGSGAVDDYLLVARNLCQARFNLIHWYSYSAFDPGFASVIRPLAA